MGKFPKTIKQHHDNVRALGCCVTRNPYPTIHHVHGGSVKDAGLSSGTSQRGVSEALVIPLAAGVHTGNDGIDYGVGVRTWEEWYGLQTEHLDWVNERLPYDIFELHEYWLKNPPKKG